MCIKLNIGDAKLDEIVEAIKENSLSRNNFPRIIVGTGMSASFGVPGMWKLANELENVLSKHKDSNIRALWGAKAKDIKNSGLEDGLKSITPAESVLVEEIKKITAYYILQEEEKLHDDIRKVDSGFARLLLYLRDTCSVNNRVLDIMTPNYDRIIEMICDRLCIGVITGFMGELYRIFNPNILKNPQKFYNIKDNFYVRLFKPHGSINWVRKGDEEFLTNDFSVLSDNSSYIEIITPGSSKYEVGLINNTFRTMREDFNELISDISRPYSLFIYGYGFNDEHFNTVLFQNENRNMLILSKEVKTDVIKRALKNPHKTVLYEESKKNYIIYKSEKYVIDEALWDINNFANIILG